MRAPVQFSWFCVLLICGYQTADSAHSPTQTSKFEYDNLGRLAQMRRTLSTGGSELYVYAYDAAGKISSIRYTGGDNDYYDFVPTCDGAGNLTETIRSFHFYSSISYQQRNQYTFSSGNLSRLIATTTIEKVVPATSVSTTDFVYDDHPNRAMNSIYHSLVKALAWVIRADQTGRHFPSTHSPQDSHQFMSKIKSNAGRFKR